MATAADAAVLLPQLMDRGWAPFGEPAPTAAADELVIGADRLQIMVDGQALLDDVNPAAPDGWWSAVDGLGAGVSSWSPTRPMWTWPTTRPAPSWSR